ncbi:MAG TPA: protein kinase [Ktedonobacteraceae bacterium]
MPLANSLLGQDYRLLRQLASAGTGIIYLAHHIRLNGQVALKIVPVDDELLENSRVTQRVEKLFHNKMQALAQLNHAHIMPVDDFGHEKIDNKEYFYVTMDYCRAGSLADLLAENERSQTRLTLDEAASVISQTAGALHYAHERGIVHLDLKPSNLLVSHAGFSDLQLADFGLAYFFATLSGRGLSQSPYIRGAAMFIAPEQWDGQAVPASDQYALAVLAFYLLTGQFPFQGPLSQLIQQHQTARPPAPSHFNRQLDSSIDKVIKRALARQPEKRFPSVLEFSQACASALQLAGAQPGPRAFDVATSAPEPLPALLPSIPPTLPARAEGFVAHSEKETLPEQGATWLAPVEVLALSEKQTTSDEEEDILRAPTERLILHQQKEDILRTPTETLVLRHEETTTVSELAAAATVPARLSSPDLVASPAAQHDHALTITATSPVLTDDEATPLAQPPELTSDAPILLMQSSGPTGDALTLLMQPPELTSDAPALFTQPPVAADDAPTRLAPGLAGAQARDARNAFPPTRPASMPAAFSMALTIQPAAAALAGQSALRLKQAPVLPSILPVLPVRQAIPRRGHFSTLQKSLAVVVLALVVLLGSGAFLFRNLSAAGLPRTGSGWWPGQTSGNNGGITIIVSPTDPDQTAAAGSTATPATGSTPTTGSGSTPATGSTPTTGSGSRPAPTPTPAPAPQPTPTPKPPTPTPTPHPCSSPSWSSTLSPTYAAGGTAHYVTPYCNGNVYLTLTSKPPSGGHEVDMQICYGMRTTNCSGWVKYSGNYVWFRVASGLKSGQIFYINSRCSACTGSSFKIYGIVKY